MPDTLKVVDLRLKAVDLTQMGDFARSDVKITAMIDCQVTSLSSAKNVQHQTLDPSPSTLYLYLTLHP
jgi:hypothetical protein